MKNFFKHNNTTLGELIDATLDESSKVTAKISEIESLYLNDTLAENYPGGNRLNIAMISLRHAVHSYTSWAKEIYGEDCKEEIVAYKSFLSGVIELPENPHKDSMTEYAFVLIKAYTICREINVLLTAWSGLQVVALKRISKRTRERNCPQYVEAINQREEAANKMANIMFEAANGFKQVCEMGKTADEIVISEV